MRRQASVQTAHLSLESIERGVVRLRDGQYRGVLQVGSVNFGLLGPGQQEALIAGYTGFLNGLGFPVQILRAGDVRRRGALSRRPDGPNP